MPNGLLRRSCFSQCNIETEWSSVNLAMSLNIRIKGGLTTSGRNLRTRCNILSASATTRPCAVNLEIPSLYRSHPFQRSSQNLVKSLWESSPLQAAVSAVPMHVPWLRGWCPASFGATKSHSFQCLTTCRSIQFSQLIK